MFLLGFKPILVVSYFFPEKTMPFLINGDEICQAPSVINEHSLSPMVEVVLVSGHSAWVLGFCPWGP